MAHPMQLIYDDLVAAMEGQPLGAASPSYSHYVSYLRQKEDTKREALDYWVKYLDGVSHCHFPCFVPRRGERNTTDPEVDSDSVHVPISETLPQLLDQFAHKHSVTPASVFQAAWAMVLHQYTQSDQVCFGYALAGRDIPVEAAGEIVGPFVNLFDLPAEYGCT